LRAAIKIVCIRFAFRWQLRRQRKEYAVCGVGRVATNTTNRYSVPEKSFQFVGLCGFAAQANEKVRLLHMLPQANKPRCGQHQTPAAPA
jgi:hypothetical protein